MKKALSKARLADRVWASLWPSHALRRLRARAVLAAYEATRPDRDRRRQRRERRGPNAPVREAARPLRERVRELEQNTDIVPGALAILTAAVVGPGVRPEPQAVTVAGHLADDLNARLQDLWAGWAERGEVTWQHAEPSAQELAVRTWMRDGEVFVVHHLGPQVRHGSAVPYSYELREPDLCPTDLRAPDAPMGVEFDSWRRPVAYRFLLRHPLDDASRPGRERTERVPADRVSHLAYVTRVGQARGVSPFAPVLARLGDIDDIDEAERIAARVAAALAVFIRKGEPMVYQEPPAGARREIELEPGLVIDDLRPGEDIGSIASTRPNMDTMAFRAEQMRSVAGGIGVSYSALARRYDGTYSSQRQELVEQAVLYRALWRRYVDRVEAPKWRWFVRAAELAGLLRVPPEVRRESVLRPVYTPAALPWIDPMREVRAWQGLVESELESREHIARLRGRDPQEIERQIARERRQEPA